MRARTTPRIDEGKQQREGVFLSRIHAVGGEISETLGTGGLYTEVHLLFGMQTSLAHLARWVNDLVRGGFLVRQVRVDPTRPHGKRLRMLLLTPEGRTRAEAALLPAEIAAYYAAVTGKKEAMTINRLQFLADFVVMAFKHGSMIPPLPAAIRASIFTQLAPLKALLTQPKRTETP